MERVVRFLLDANNIAIFMHIRPDGDTIGSALALRIALKALKKQVTVYCEDALPQKFAYLQGFDEVQKGELQSEHDGFVSVDCSDEFRLGKYCTPFMKAKNTAIIDHHKSNTLFAKNHYVKVSYAATSMLVLEIIDMLGVKLNYDIAQCLYSGLSTDTGNFSHSNTDKKVFAVACRLLDQDIDVGEITTKIYKSSSKARIKLMGEVISGMRFYENDTVSIMTISKEQISKFFAKDEDTEGFIDFAIGISGVEIGVCIMEHNQNSYKVSFRSKKKDVCQVAMQFGGGGHILASGCMINGFLEDVIDKIVRAIEVN